MPQSTAKKQLLEQDLTPAKKLVARDINSWMQTHQKSAKNKNVSVVSNVSCRYKMYKRLPPRFNSQEHKQSETPNISALKRRKDDLMKTRTHKKWTCQNTKPNTAEVSTGQQKKPLQWLMKLPLIHVNQFVAEQKQKQQFQQATVVPAIPAASSKNSVVTSRKSSLKKIDRKLKERIEHARLYNFKQFQQLHKPSIRDFSAQNKEVIQQKICKNNYMGLLSSVRKSSRVIFELKMDKFSIRI